MLGFIFRLSLILGEITVALGRDAERGRSQLSRICLKISETSKTEMKLFFLMKQSHVFKVMR